MKKLLGLIVLLIVAWLGATAYIGSQVEPRIDDYISKINMTYKDNGFVYSSKVTESSFLNSQVELEVKSIIDANMTPIKIPVKLEHGPLFFGGNDLFGIVRSHQEISFKDELLALAPDINISDIIKESDVDIITDLVIGFDKKLNLKMQVTPFTLIGQESGDIEVVGMAIKSTNDTQSMLGDGEIKIGQLVIKNSPKNKIELIDSELTWVTNKIISKSLALGDFSMSSDELKIYEDSKVKTTLSPTVVASVSQDSNATIGANINIAYKHIDGDYITQGVPLTTASSTYVVGGLGIKGVEELISITKRIQKVQDEQLQIINNSQGDTEVMAKAMSQIDTSMPTPDEIISTLKNIFIQDTTYLELSTIMDTKESKANKLNTKITISKDIKAMKSPKLLSMLKSRLKMLEMLSISVDLSVDERFAKSLGDRIGAFSKLEKGVKEGFVVKNTNRYSAEIKYKNDVLMINKKENPQILTMLKMIIGI